MHDLQLARYPDGTALLGACAAFLLEHEAQHCVALGFAMAHRDRRPPTGPAIPAIAGVSLFDRAGPRFVAGITSRGALLSAVERPADIDGLASTMATAIAASHLSLGSFDAEADVAEAFARHWHAATGREPRLVLRQGVYRLDRLVPPARPAPGRPRRFEVADLPLVGEWVTAFSAEAVPHDPPVDGTAIASDWLGDPWREVWLWEQEGRPVSMALAAWPTPNGIRVSHVYTPPAERGRGYATAVTAAVTASQLAAGRRSCYLFTDLSNPTSNAIYQAIGYRRVAETDRYLAG